MSLWAFSNPNPRCRSVVFREFSVFVRSQVHLAVYNTDGLADATTPPPSGDANQPSNTSSHATVHPTSIEVGPHRPTPRGPTSPQPPDVSPRLTSNSHPHPTSPVVQQPRTTGSPKRPRPTTRQVAVGEPRHDVNVPSPEAEVPQAPSLVRGHRRHVTYPYLRPDPSSKYPIGDGINPHSTVLPATWESSDRSIPLVTQRHDQRAASRQSTVHDAEPVPVPSSGHRDRSARSWSGVASIPPESRRSGSPSSTSSSFRRPSCFERLRRLLRSVVSVAEDTRNAPSSPIAPILP